MDVSDPGYEIFGSEDIINVSHVKERIARLRPWTVEQIKDQWEWGHFPTRESAWEYLCQQPERDGLGICEDLGKTAELEALRQLLSDLGGIGDDSYLIHDDYLEEYAQDDTELPADSPLSPYVDWKRVADDNYRSNYASVSFRGSTYWVVAR